MSMSSIPNALLAKIDENPDKIILRGGDKAYSYGEIKLVASGLARILGEKTDKERVGLMFPSSPAFACAFLGIQLAGKIPVPLNFLLEPKELFAIFRDADIDTLIVSLAFKEKMESLPLNLLFMEEVYADACAGGPIDMPAVQAIQKDDIATLLYTSGTTGDPKGVMLSHGNLLSNVEACTTCLHISDEDIFLGVLPMFHSFAMLTSFLLPLLRGCETVYLPRFVPQQVLETIHENKISVLMAVPSMYRLLNKVAAKKGLAEHSLRAAFSGGEPLSQDIRNEFESIFKRPLLEGYGLTETSPVVCFNTEENNRAGTAGKTIPGVRIKIVDENAAELGPECDGEIWIQGPNVMLGYWQKPEESATVLTADGWFKTGDIGNLCADGFLRITGRLKEMIISSGENIYPAEIEQAIDAHEAVFESAVFGVADPKRGEVPYAVIAVHEGKTLDPTELKEHLRDRLAAYKIPTTFEFRDSLPHGPTGKIARKILVREHQGKV